MAEKRGTTYKLQKQGQLIRPRPEMPAPGPYYPCLVSMSSVRAFPFDYALYFSTDHDTEEGGIWLHLCNGDPTEAANWVSYDDAVEAGRFDHLDQKPSANPIYLDTVQGDGHTETAYANVIDSTVYLTYHKNNCGHNQATLLATSTDGINFSRLNGDADSIILDYEPSERHGDGHTGYFRWTPNPFSGIEHAYVGYSLHGGGDNFHSAIWGSNDAIQWDRLDILDPIQGFAVPKDDMELIWHEIDPTSITRLDDDEYIAICGVGTRASGGVARVTELYEIFLGADGRTLKRECRKILDVEPGKDDAEELAQPTSLLIDDQLLLVYIGARDEGSVNTIMAAVGKLDRTTDRPTELPESERRRHIQEW
jgi:hypothetical protein